MHGLQWDYSSPRSPHATGDIINEYKLSVRKTEMKMSFGKCKRRPEDNIKTSIKDTLLRMWTEFIYV
jgi:hypothetical protein